jgi:uncharacterized protein YjbI with pentapeptide repeats
VRDEEHSLGPKKPSRKRSQVPQKDIWTTVKDNAALVAAVIALIGVLITGGITLTTAKNDAETQRLLEEEQTQDVTLQAYLDAMRQLLLDGGLATSEPDSGVPALAYAQTLATMKRLDGGRNDIVMGFLRGSGLLSEGEDSVLTFEHADLNSVDLANNNFANINLRFVQLRSADLHNANLAHANLDFGDLASTNLQGADLRHAALLFANLEGAHLEGADFESARLTGADLSGANLAYARNLTQDQIDHVGLGDDETKLPVGLKRPYWWTKPNAIGRPPEALGATLKDFDTLSGAQKEEIGMPAYVTTGVVIYDVQPGSAAANEGLITGDIIYQVGTKQVRGPKDVQDTLQEKEQGSRVRFGVYRYSGTRVGPQDREDNSSERVTVQGWRNLLLYPRLGD